MTTKHGILFPCRKSTNRIRGHIDEATHEKGGSKALWQSSVLHPKPGLFLTKGCWFPRGTSLQLFQEPDKGPQASVRSFSSDTRQIYNSVAWFLVSLEVEKALKFSVMVNHVCWCLPPAHLQRSTRGSSLASWTCFLFCLLCPSIHRSCV